MDCHSKVSCSPAMLPTVATTTGVAPNHVASPRGAAATRVRRRGFGRGCLTAALVGAAVAASPATAASPQLAHTRTTAAAGVPGATAAATAAANDLSFLNDTVVRVETRAIPSAESSESLGERRSGTGVLIDNNTVLTIGYLLLEAEAVEMHTPSGKRIPGTVAGYDPESGLGLVRSAVPLDGRPLELGDSDTVLERERVLTLGHGEPEATELMVVSRKLFTGSWEYLIDRAIYTFPPVNNWSGAALVNRDGKLVGIGALVVGDAATSRPDVPGNLYVPVNLLKPVLADLLATGRRGAPTHPWLGVTTEVVRGNVMVSSVTRGGPAAKAGLVPGDIIVSVSGTRVETQPDFYRVIWQSGSAGITVPLRVLKDGDLREIEVKTMDRMDSLSRPQGI